MKVALDDVAKELRKLGGDTDRLAVTLLPVREAGLLDLALAARWGGGEASMSHIVETVRQASRLDGSLGFLLSQAALGHLITAGFDDAVLDEMHRKRPAAIAGVFAPKGRARRGVGGWHVMGQWPLATGAVLADYVYVQCSAMEGRKLLLGPFGDPLPVLAILPADRIRIERTWHSVGLVATASDTIVAEGVAVAEPWLAALLPIADQYIEKIPVRPFRSSDMAGLPIAAVAVGLAEGLLEAVALLGRKGRRAAFERLPMADSVTARRDMGSCAMQIEAAAALLERAAAGGFGPDRAGRARAQAATACVVDLCLDAASVLQPLAGSEAIYRDGDIARRMEDLRTVSLHAWANRYRTEPLGGLMLGGAVDPALLPADPLGGDERESMATGDQPFSIQPDNARRGSD